MEEPIALTCLADGRTRHLRYTVGSTRRLRKILNKQMLGTGSALIDMDEERLPEAILEGMVEKLPDGTWGKSSEQITAEQLADLMPTPKLKEILEAFLKAFFGIEEFERIQAASGDRAKNAPSSQ